MKTNAVKNLIEETRKEIGNDAVFVINMKNETKLGTVSKMTDNFLTVRTFFGADEEIPFEKVVFARHINISELLTIANGLIHQIKQYANKVIDDRLFLGRHNLHL